MNSMPAAPIIRNVWDLMRCECEHHTVAIMNAIVIDPSNKVGIVRKQI